MQALLDCLLVLLAFLLYHIKYVVIIMKYWRRKYFFIHAKPDKKQNPRKYQKSHKTHDFFNSILCVFMCV